jgi:hypothetical protein
VTPEAAAGLRKLAEALPAGTPVPVPSDWLLDLLNGQGSPERPAEAMDPTVEELAARYRRAPSTVRGWCEAGRFPGAYKLHAREWRIPAAAIGAFEARARARDCRADRGRNVVRCLSDWRHVS